MKALGGFAHQGAAHDLDFEHHRLHIARDDDIAAAAKDELGGRPQVRVGQQGLHIGFAGDAHQRLRLGHDVKGVVGLEWDVFLD